VLAVEPQPALRERLAGAIGADRVREGVAEAIPLADGSVAAVTVADGFHWFDAGRALSEMRRVLVPAAAWPCSPPFRIGVAPRGRMSWGR
jgi:ubiquinone/menaquinone biosynthesis C-methylase UbiE